MADLLATPVDLAAALQRDVDTASATLALEVATAVVQAAAGQRIVRATTTETTYGTSDQVLRLKQRPVLSVTSVTYGGIVLSQGTASGTWRLTSGGVWRDLGWVEVVGEPYPAVVVYEAGYDEDEQEIQLSRGVCLSIARGLFTNPDGVTREQIDDYSVAYAEAASAMDAMPSMAARLRKFYGAKAGLVRVV